MFIHTYLLATITDGKGSPRSQGCCLMIYNSSDRYPAYFGLSGVVNQKIYPRQRKIIPLGIYYSKQDTRPTVIEVYLYWWQQK